MDEKGVLSRYFEESPGEIDKSREISAPMGIQTEQLSQAEISFNPKRFERTQDICTSMSDRKLTR